VNVTRYTEPVTLSGLLGRALAVALLFGVLLLPAADHHLAARLPGALDLDAYQQQTHHHRLGAGAGERAYAAPLLLPLDAAGLGVSAQSSFADVPLGVAPPPLGGSALFEPALPAPASLLEPPPLPPPVLPA
jgi:hypothetical protein